MKLNKTLTSRIWVYLLLILILLVGGYLRLVGLDWDEEQHLHPDERFLTMVESSLYPVEDPRDYFNTAESTLNPHNQGHTFFVYGTLPIFLIRYLGEWLGYTGYGEIYLVGRTFSAVIDLLSVVLVFFIGTRLFNRWVGLLGAALSAFAVLQIQLSHFFTVDTFITFFSLLAVYFAVEVVTPRDDQINLSSYLLFGIALGMAVASKINAAPVALTLPLAALIYWIRLPDEKKNTLAPKILLYLVLAASISLLTFRICQPYAFNGPGFFNFSLNENWVSSLKALRAQTSGDVDFPPALQWARRPIWFSLKNMVFWGLGIPYGLMAWGGFAWMGYGFLAKKSWKPELVIWAWTGFYFVWQSTLWNSTMRYQAPIYPLLAVFAGWLVVNSWEKIQNESITLFSKAVSTRVLRPILIGLGILSLLFTAGWAVAFSAIYTMPHPRVDATRWIFQNIPGAGTLVIETDDGPLYQLLSYPDGLVIEGESAWFPSFEAKADGSLEEIIFPVITNQDPSNDPPELVITLVALEEDLQLEERREILFSNGEAELRVNLEPPLEIREGRTYQMRVGLNDPAGAVAMHGTGIASESSWDDGIPLRMEGYDPFGGIYQGGLNLELYWDDNPEKLDRFITTLDQTEYIIITSSRQWATTTRVPERYPLTSEYYRQLMGCPINLSIEACYNRALPGDYQGNLGFTLIKTFQSNPKIGILEINDQPAEEAFTVYDHPKVFIFKKDAGFSREDVADILGRVDLTLVMHITPKQADEHPGNLMLPPGKWAQQREGGTWSRLFNPQALHNRSQLVGSVLWYLVVFILGVLIYPLQRLVLNGLKDFGYPLARVVGLLILSYLAWLAGSTGIPFTRISILIIFALIGAAGAAVGYYQRDQFLQEWKENKNYFLLIEILAVSLFIMALLIRFGNPDLWHPWKGGERPMDFSYFNAVLKSTSFPPYDPWFAGGYINYYYYGFVFVGVLVKLLGITPSFAYNLIQATIFMFLGLGGFSLGWNLLKADPKMEEDHPGISYISGGAGLLGLVIFGNLGILRMVFQGLQRLASAGIDVLEGSFFQRVKWTLLGIVQLIRTKTLHYRLDEWYWNPSRTIGAEHGGPITEFPFFTFLYGDPHAHFISLPITLVVIAWVLSVAISARKPGRDHPWKMAAVTLFGALAVGTLRPTNTWDFYPYLALGVCVLLYQWWAGTKRDDHKWYEYAFQLLLFFVFAYLFFKPYADWYGEGYTSIKPWFGTHTPANDYFIHWGLFLLVIFSWMAAETVHWMATTPVSALNNLKKYRELIIAGLLMTLVIMISFGVPLENKVTLGSFTILGSGVHIIWFVLPLMVWAGILIFRPEMPQSKQIVLFLIGTALALTLMVEVVYVEGDIGRMNTVFKFYLVAWSLFALSSAASLSWIVVSLENWKPFFKTIWQVVVYILVISAALYPFLGGVAKIKDRMAMNAPQSLDGMDFMKYASYADLETYMDLSQDYDAIRWMQDNVQGSPVIVEANQVEYHWGTRYTVYTGLPGVVGWNWHQRQQRTLTPGDWVFNRVEEVNSFYDSTDLSFAREFLRKYDVQYIVLGQLEKAKYLPVGIEKFEAAEGVLWSEVYRDQDTTIYQTLTSFQ
jgi:YYY domain-containing protein